EQAGERAGLLVVRGSEEPRLRPPDPFALQIASDAEGVAAARDRRRIVVGTFDDRPPKAEISLLVAVADAVRDDDPLLVRPRVAPQPAERQLVERARQPCELIRTRRPRGEHLHGALDEG